MPSGGQLERDLIELIGVTAMVALAEEHGGTRVYIPQNVHRRHQLAHSIGIEAATKLAEVYSPDTIMVPLAREMRAVHYRGQGLSNSRIAVRLGMTEKGVELLFRRLIAEGVELPFRPKLTPSVEYWRFTPHLEKPAGSICAS